MKNRKRVLVEVFLTLLFLAGSLYYITHKDIRVQTTFSICAKASKGDLLHLIPGSSPAVKARVTRAFREIDFPLPLPYQGDLQLDAGKKGGQIIIKYIKIKTPLKTYQWPAERIKEVFASLKGPGNPNPIERFIKYKNGRIIIRKTLNNKKNSLSILLGKTITTELNSMSRSRLFFYLVVGVCALLFFYLVHFITWRGLRKFCSWKIISNLTLFFILVISFPLADDFFHITRSLDLPRLEEKRAKASKPAFHINALARYSSLYTAYYNDDFSLRPLFIPLNNYLKVKAFGVSPISSVAVGKEGWLYLARQNAEVDQLEYYRSFRLLTTKELEHWRVALEARRDWLAARGIHYLFIIAPNKSTIYPEFLPSNIQRAGQTSRLDQLTEYLTQHSDIVYLDLRKAMFAGKKQNFVERVYRKTDSHWNLYGAYLAYVEIMKALGKFFPGVKPIDISKFRVFIDERNGGDLAIMLSLQGSLYRDDVIEVKPLFDTMAREGKPLEKQYPRVRESVIECPGAELPTALVVHDSFFNRLRHFLSEHFTRVIYLRDWGLNFYADLIEKEKPKIVIDQMAERFLLNMELSLPPQ